MMNPEMMKMAMEQMSKMTPQQMADMQRQMASLPPGFVQQQMAAMNSMGPAELQQRMRDANQGRPQEQPQGSIGLSPHSMQELLKQEGNKLFSAGKYSEAATHYERAKAELRGHTSSGAAALRDKCSLNLASCYLKLEQHDKCAEQCSEVLQGNPEDRKALYRRGQSYSALKQYPAAVADLRAALERSPAEEKSIIRERLQQAEQGLAGSGKADAISGDPETHQEPVSSAEPTKKEAVRQSATEPQASAHARPSPSFGAPSMPVPNMSAQGMQQTLQMMRENPGMMEQMRSTFACMSPEQMQAAAKMAGMPEGPGFDPEQMQQAADMMASMSQEALEQMTCMAASHSTGIEQQQPQTLQVQPSGSQQALDAVQANPDIMKQAMDMMGQMDPEQMASMMGSMRSGAPETGPDPSAMAGLLSDPKSRDMMRQMMSNIDPQQLAAISKASGQALTPEQAEMMSAQMRNMSDSQMEKLLATMSWLQSASSALQKVKRKISENRVVVLALAVLLLAILLRWLGVL